MRIMNRILKSKDIIKSGFAKLDQCGFFFYFTSAVNYKNRNVT